MKKKTLIIIIVSSFLLMAALATAIFLIPKKGKVTERQTTVVGFYDIPDDYYEIYKEIITKDNNAPIEIVKLSEKEVTKKSLTKNIDMLITYNGAITQKLLPKAATLPQDLMARFSRTINASPLYNYNNEPKIFPITMDMFETNVLTTAVNYYNLPQPENTEDLLNFGKAASPYYPVPIVLPGGDDLTLNSFFTQLVEAYGGETGYKNIQTQLLKDRKLNNFYKYEITTGNKDNQDAKPVTVSTILDLINSWEGQNILTSNWRTASTQYTEQLIEDNRVTLALMPLTEHRKIKSSNLNYYESIVFPDMPEYTDGQRLNIQSAIVGMIFRNTPQTKIISSRLTTTENQESISMQTQLGPATLQGTPFDRQSDNCRFFAASFPGGPVPDLATLVFEDKESQHKMAELIRNYK